MQINEFVQMFQKAKNSVDFVVIEGVQALKHAVRFGAEIEHVVTCDITVLRTLLDELAPDISSVILPKVEQVSDEVFQKISPKNHRTKVATLAKRRAYSVEDIAPDKPVVFLEDPKDLENIGAVIRVAAAAGVGAVVSSGQADIWHPAIIRGGAGLQYAVPVLNASLKAITGDRQLVALDPQGDIISGVTIEKNAVLIFGTERHGIAKETLESADCVVRLPMQEGVSSLNLATSVAATVYGVIDY